jgi:LPS sulfotransferase NodH
LIYSQFYHHPEIFLYLILYQIRLIHLVRQNVLDVILSREAAKIRGISHSYHRVETVQVYLDPVTLIKRLKTHEAKTAYFRRMISLMGISCLEIHYEDLLADQSSYHQVLDFLGISGQPGLSSSLQKLNPISHQMVIENYHVIQRLLAETPYRRFLH